MANSDPLEHLEFSIPGPTPIVYSGYCLSIPPTRLRFTTIAKLVIANGACDRRGLLAGTDAVRPARRDRIYTRGPSVNSGVSWKKSKSKLSTRGARWPNSHTPIVGRPFPSR